MFKNWLVILVLSPLLLLGNIWEAEEESLFVRRIADFWEEGEYALAGGQIEEFIALYPESTFVGPLANALADLLIREKSTKRLSPTTISSKTQSSKRRPLQGRCSASMPSENTEGL